MYEDPIAIIGAACRLPGAKNLVQFWDVLSSGRDAVTEIPDQRWSKEFYYNPNPAERGKSYTWAAGVIDDIDRFDAAFFGISPREAEQIDPQQRLLLELAWEAIEDAGLPAASIAGGGGGVYIGASSGDYADIRFGDPSSGDAYFMTGATASILANRLSYVLDLHGPSFTVDTACSSSLVALDLACRAIRDQRVPMALVGGVSLLLAPYPFIGFCRASMLSPRGRCFAFDARADGYVRAEGGAVMVLKPLSRALADGDPVRGLILGTGVNSDGRTIGLSLPNRVAQSALLRSVYRESGVSPESLDFMEAHGTGTPAGDPIELSAIGEALGRKRASPLRIGSVKTNVGHLEAASGMAGLMKTLLGLEKRLIPPSLHFETPNPNIPFAELNLEVVTRPTPLDAGRDRLLAGVNSFGFGGTNAHAILASPPRRAPEAAADDHIPPQLLPPLLLSARTEAALKSLVQDWSTRLADSPPEKAAGLIRAAARRRDHHKCRLVAMGEGPLDIADKLDSFAAAASTSQVTTGLALPSGKVAFIFTGNGAQRPGMAADALKHNAVFRDALLALDETLRPKLGWSVVERLSGNEDPRILARTDVAQPLLFAVQVGVIAALRAAGVEATAFAGHSVGEIAAGWAAGALTLDDACAVIVARSHHQQRTEGCGRMAALGLGVEQAEDVLAALGGNLEIAAVNSSRAVTVAGSRTALDRLEAEARREEWRYTELDLDYAFHSVVLDFIRDDLIADLDGLEPRDCGDRFTSTVEGCAIAGDLLDEDYWWRNIREPVRFSDAVRDLIARDYRIFVEIGPNPALQSYIRDGLKAADAAGRVIATLAHRQHGADPLPAIVAECHVAGADISRSEVFDGPVNVPELPRYPWQHETYWFGHTSEGLFLNSPLRDHPLLGFRTDPGAWRWKNTLSTALQPWLADHRIEGVPVVAAAALLEIALAAARAQFPAAPCLEVIGLEIPRALVIEEGVTRELLVWSGQDGRLEIESRSRLSDEPRTVHAVARVAPGSGQVPSLPAATEIVRRVEAVDLYGLAAALGLDYGPLFQTIAAIDITEDGEALVTLVQHAVALRGGDTILDPTLFDGALQACFALLVDRVSLAPGESFIPSRFGRTRVFSPYGRRPVTARVTIKRAGVRSVCAAVSLFDEAGRVVAEADDCWFQRVRLTREDSLGGKIFRTALVAAPRSEDRVSPEMDVGAAVAAGLAVTTGENAYGDARLLFDAYLAAAASEAVWALVADGAIIRVDALIESGAVAADAAPLLSWLLWAMERNGAAIPIEDGWRLAEDGGLPDSALIWRTLMAESPELMPELVLSASADLPVLLRDGLKGGNLPSALVEHMLFASPSGEQTIRCLSKAVVELAGRWPAGRPLRIIELGAGTGVLTRRLLSALAGWPGTLNYVATDADAQMVPRLGTATAGRIGAFARHWDPRDAAGEAPAGRYDIVLSLYALTRLGLDDRALTRVHDRLAPGGVLLGAEPEPNEAWNAVFGRRDDWWGDSIDSRFPLSPLRDGASWADSITRAGFSGATADVIAGGLWSATLLTGDRAADLHQIPELPRSDAAVILIAAQGQPLAMRLRALLISIGADVRTIDPPEVADGAALCAALAEAGETAPHVVILPPAGGREFGSTDEATWRMTAALTVTRLVADARERANLWIVTLDAQGTAAPNPNEAALWGLGRTIANELSQLHCRMVDLASGCKVDDAALILFDEIKAPDDEREIVWTAAGRHVSRIRGGLKPALAPAAATELVVTQPGLLDTLSWQRIDPVSPGPDEIAVEVCAVGLNFRDVMWAMALLPEEALLDGFSGPSLGLECTGIVSEVGSGVSEFAVGDRVMALAPAALRSQVVTKAHAAVRLPEMLSFGAGATIPVAHLTAVYSLDRLARLSAGEWVLIHGGAGGVGIAAIQYAQHKGAIVIATAGSNAKRAFLRNLGVDHVLDSRDLSFADDIRQLTGGRGIDVVLNSLSGEAMERSIGLLKPFGRFLELGKRDFMMDTRVGLRPLRQNISYFAVDVDRLPVERPEVAGGLLREIAELVEAGVLRPLPWRAYPFAEAAEAFRLMQGAGHIGKIVLEPDGHLVPAAPGAGLVVRPDRTYLITGGLSGFGLETARWLADRGARHFALLSRRGADAPEASEALTAFAARSVDARAFACDVADSLMLGNVLGRIRRDMPPLAGVIHAAMVVDDGLVGDLTSDRIARVLGPKLDGAVNLDRLTRRDPVELFLLYSSATTLLGAPGQGSYVAANSALEALARGRVSSGLPGLAIAWGPIGDVGYLSRQEETRDALIRRLATAPMAARDALDMLPRLLASGEPVLAFAPVRWEAAHKVLPILGTPTFADLASRTSEISNVDLKERLSELSASEAKDLIVSLLTEEVARILSFSADRIDPLRPLSEFGMDSLMAVELRLAVETRLGIDMPLVSLSDNTSLSTIASRMVRGLSKPEVKATVLDAMLRHETSDMARVESESRQGERMDAE